MKTVEEKAAARKAAAAKAAATRAAKKAAAAAAPSLEEAAATVAAAAPAPLSRNAKRDEWRKAQEEARALLAPLLGAEQAPSGDEYGLRKRGERQITPEAHALLALAIPAAKAEVRGWELKGSATAFQVAGPIAPIEGAETPRERALALALNQCLAPFVGFRLRVVRYSGKRGVSYAASIAIAGR